MRPALDEHFDAEGHVRPLTEALWRHIDGLAPGVLASNQLSAEEEIRSSGVTFGGEPGAAERPWPFDVIPRVIAATEWDRVREGLVQRLVALNLFIDDCYHDQRAVSAGVVPAERVLSSPNFRPECVGAAPPGGIWAHIAGTDLVRDADGTLVVLEDNLRVPSGVSYMLENRMVAKRVFPELFRSYSVEPLDHSIGRLAALLTSVAPAAASAEDPTVVVLTPGVCNSAYYEHAFLAQQLGVELVSGDDLLVLPDDTVTMRTIDGLQRVDVVYRRVDDLFLDPEVFRRDSLVGARGLLRAWRSGKVALVNAPGAGVADDKALYPLVPDLIRYFLGEEPILPNVPTYCCAEPDDRRYVLGHLDELVVKPAHESGGYGIVIGPQAGPGALDLVARRIEQHPAGWVAQPVLSLSTVPTLCEGEVVACHVDLRPFTMLGPTGSYVTAGGLTRVARAAGSLIVNSSQGGGSKDTWVVDAVSVAGDGDDARPFVPVGDSDAPRAPTGVMAIGPMTTGPTASRPAEARAAAERVAAGRDAQAAQ